MKKTIIRQYLAETMTNADYANDLALHSLKPAVGWDGFYLNANKIENVF